MRTQLQTLIEKKRQNKNILIMSHCVMGYPSFEFNTELVDVLTRSGVDLIELQFPFSDPQADGPVLSAANQISIDNGSTVAECFRQAAGLIAASPGTIFVIMTYFNIIYQYGCEAFVKKAAEIGIRGIISPDMTPEAKESQDYLEAMDKHGVSPILLTTPFTPPDRLAFIMQQARGMIYCVSRKGITGSHTKFGEPFAQYIRRVKAAGSLPVGVGFGVRTGKDLQRLQSLGVDIGIICSYVIDMSMKQGLPAVETYLRALAEDV